MNMRNQTNFTRSGYLAFTKVVLSCYPIHYELNIRAMEYLKKVVDGEIALDCEVLLEKIPVLKNSILEFAKKNGYPEISDDVVVKFFAGSVHYEKILLDFEEYKLHIAPGSVYSLRTMFAHLAVPVELVASKEDGFVGKYFKGQFDFLVKGLVATNDDKLFLDRNLPRMVLIHFATIVDVNPSAELLGEIIKLQESAEMFFRACKFLQLHHGVDYNSFPADCRKKTEKALKNISLC